MSSSPAQSVASAVASGLAALRAAARPIASPVARLWRLAGLRSVTRGEIPVTTQFDGPVHAVPGTRLALGRSCRLGRGAYFETGDSGAICIGSRVRINTGCVIVSYAAVTIGDDCLIGEYVSIRDADHGSEPGTPMRLQTHRSAPIRIGRDVWIARGAVILKGVTIGEGAIIGANSVVTRDIPPMAIAAGAPARVLKFRSGAETPEQLQGAAERA